MVQRSYQKDRSRAITVQCLARTRSAKSELRKRKKEKEDVDALQAKIKAYEVCVCVVKDHACDFFFLFSPLSLFVSFCYSFVLSHFLAEVGNVHACVHMAVCLFVLLLLCSFRCPQGQQ